MMKCYVLFSVDGDWGPWGSWSDCTRSCGSGNQKRYRVCHEPLFGGKSCLGDESQVRKCNVKPCTGEHFMKVLVYLCIMCWLLVHFVTLQFTGPQSERMSRLKTFDRSAQVAEWP